MTSGEARTTERVRVAVRERLRRYRAADGSAREIVLIDGARGSRLVIDRRVAGGGDARVLAHLCRDEPDANATHVCEDYLAASIRCCRPLREEDLLAAPEGAPTPLTRVALPEPVDLIDGAGRRYRLRACGDPAELRWHREMAHAPGLSHVVSARDVVAALEDYEPVRALTRAAVVALRNDRRVSIATVGLELRRLEASPIVLNRRLREAVLDTVRRRGVSLSAIAIACGRTKRDPRGNGSGETSWLARRVGLIADGGGVPNPWVHSDTLALIARDGLGIAPHEVELG